MDAETTRAVPIPTPAKPRRRWWLHGTLAFVALIVLVPLGLMGYGRWSLESDWVAAEAETAALDPRWRLDEIEADRAVIPDAENSALHIMRVRNIAGAIVVSGAPNYGEIFEKLPPTAELNSQQVRLIRGELAKIAKPLEEARKLKDMPRGRFPIVYDELFVSTSLTEQAKARDVADWLQHDAYLLAHEHEVDRAVAACRGMINAGRAFGDEPLVFSFMTHVALQTAGINTLERVLAQGRATEDALRPMQELLASEIGNQHFLQALRGDRAGWWRCFEAARAGRIKASDLGSDYVPWITNTFPGTVLRKCPAYLRHMNEGIEIAKLPIEERHAKMKEWAADVMHKDRARSFARMYAPGPKVHNADCRSQAMLRSAVAALACERYRLVHKDWPVTLDELVKAKLVDKAPTDPMDGKPLRYRRTRDGVVIYSIGIDLADNQGNIDRTQPDAAGVDVGFRLWNVDRRRQPPLPPMAIAEEAPN